MSNAARTICQTNGSIYVLNTTTNTARGTAQIQIPAHVKFFEAHLHSNGPLKVSNTNTNTNASTCQMLRRPSLRRVDFYVSNTCWQSHSFEW